MVLETYRLESTVAFVVVAFLTIALIVKEFGEMMILPLIKKRERPKVNYE